MTEANYQLVNVLAAVSVLVAISLVDFWLLTKNAERFKFHRLALTTLVILLANTTGFIIWLCAFFVLAITSSSDGSLGAWLIAFFASVIMITFSKYAIYLLAGFKFGNKKLASLVIVNATSPLLAVISLIIAWRLIEPYWVRNCHIIAPMTFSRQAWDEADGNGDNCDLLDRARMLNDLKSQFGLIGMPKKQIVQLLGPWGHLDSDEALQYDVGNGIFIIHFKNGTVSGYQISPTYETN